jgi:peptidyl-prolyl cis-trans isomerase C
MTWKVSIHKRSIFILIISHLLLSACDGNVPTNSQIVPNPTITATLQASITTPSTVSPSPTTDPATPLAAIVNGQAITMTEFQAEFNQALAASETGLLDFTKDDILQNLIDEVLLAQGAAEAGFIPDDTLLKTRLDQLAMDENAIQAWISVNGYTDEEFQQVFSRAIAAAWMRDQIIASVPNTAEQVHARQILLYNFKDAENAYAQLQAGTDFATLAIQYDPVASGDLGWFPRGYLTVPELDEPIFSLQPGEYTQIIETILGFHIVQMIERDNQRPLSPGAFQTYQVQAVENWLANRRSQSDIQIFFS